VYIGGGNFTMRGGSISGNTFDGDGGGVYANRGRFIMEGGIIAGNNTQSGGGAFIAGGTFTKTGGTINGNDAALGNRNNASRQGHAVYQYGNPERWRNVTAGPDDKTEGYGFWLNG
jgi:hypothetical protein